VYGDDGVGSCHPEINSGTLPQNLAAEEFEAIRTGENCVRGVLPAPDQPYPNVRREA
jgi:hypothetical protein